MSFKSTCLSLSETLCSMIYAHRRIVMQPAAVRTCYYITISNVHHGDNIKTICIVFLKHFNTYVSDVCKMVQCRNGNVAIPPAPKLKRNKKRCSVSSSSLHSQLRRPIPAIPTVKRLPNFLLLLC